LLKGGFPVDDEDDDDVESMSESSMMLASTFFGLTELTFELLVVLVRDGIIKFDFLLLLLFKIGGKRDVLGFFVVVGLEEEEELESFEESRLSVLLDSFGISLGKSVGDLLPLEMIVECLTFGLVVFVVNGVLIESHKSSNCLATSLVFDLSI
jgi:hypothetical protein